MRADQLKAWMREATRERDPATTRWDALAIMTQLYFREGILSEELTWNTMILILKGRRDYRGIWTM